MVGSDVSANNVAIVNIYSCIAVTVVFILRLLII
jgi:hypothetical protein